MTIYRLTTECYVQYEHDTPSVGIYTSAEQAITAAHADRDEWLSEVAYGVDEYRICVEELSAKDGQFFTGEKLYNFLWEVDWLRTDPKTLAERAVITESYG